MDQNSELRAQLNEAKAGGHFVFCPTLPLPKTNYLYIPVLQVVKLRPDDFYPVQGGKSYGLHAHGYKKLQKAAGIEWVSEYGRTGRTDDRRDPNFCLYCAVAKFLKMEGKYHEESAYKHIDLNAKRTTAEEKYANQYDARKNKNQKVWPPDKDVYIKMYSDRDVNQIRETMDERAESGAKARAIRSVLDLPVSFKGSNNSHDGIQKRFYLVRFIPDPANEQIQRMQYAALAQAFLGIYGVAPPAQQQALISHADREPEPETPEPEETPDDDALDPEIVDFENCEPEEQVNIIQQLIQTKGYPHYPQDIKEPPALVDWEQGARTDYFRHIKAWRPKQ